MSQRTHKYTTRPQMAPTKICSQLLSELRLTNQLLNSRKNSGQICVRTLSFSGAAAG